MSGNASLSDLLQRGDLDGLVREVDRLANQGAWDDVLWLRERCHAAAEETGKQLWGAAQYAEYRTALEAPGAVAASVVLPGAARFALGPLTEVVAQHHTWDEVADHLTTPPVAAAVAQERVLRGEDLTGDPRAHGDEVGLPLVLQPWEQAYALPTYRADEVLESGPEPPPAGTVPAGPAPGRPTELPDVEHALVDLVEPWATRSTGEVHVAVVEGDAGAAVAALVTGDARLTPVVVGDAFGRMAWAAATGGALGRRRGVAAGRAAAWWVGHTVTGLAFPADADELEFHLEDLGWYVFDDGTPRTGWDLRIAVEDRDAGWAAAVDASDVREDGEPTT